MPCDDVVSLCTELVKCKSVTPADDGALDCIANYLSVIGFETKTLTFTSSGGKNRVKNLYARYGASNDKVLGFLGHSDVVPAGERWKVAPFEGIIENGCLYGRGTCDMKGGIAAFCAAVSEFVKQKGRNFDGSIVVLITGDEEIGSEQGIKSLIKWCEKYGQLPLDCLIGEPSSHKKIGDRVYIGHRGSINVTVKSIGKQGHIAYQGNYINSLSEICNYIARMLEYEWKHEDKRFPKANLEPTMLFTNNYAVNIAPDESLANINIRYGGDYKSEDLMRICEAEAKEFNVSLEFFPSGEAYCCNDEKLKSLISSAINDVTGEIPEFSCAGGTSDGRHIINCCNVIEFGLQDACIHQKDEKVKIDDLLCLTDIYKTFLIKYFSQTQIN